MRGCSGSRGEGRAGGMMRKKKGADGGGKRYDVRVVEGWGEAL